MLKVKLVTLLVCCMVILNVKSEFNEMLAPPPRPAKFKSALQLRQYLAALNEYYSIMGRPRFEKRNSPFAKQDTFSSNTGEGYADDSTSWDDFQ